MYLIKRLVREIIALDACHKRNLVIESNMHLKRNEYLQIFSDPECKDEASSTFVVSKSYGKWLEKNRNHPDLGVTEKFLLSKNLYVSPNNTAQLEIVKFGDPRQSRCSIIIDNGALEGYFRSNDVFSSDIVVRK